MTPRLIDGTVDQDNRPGQEDQSEFSSVDLFDKSNNLDDDTFPNAARNVEAVENDRPVSSSASCLSSDTCFVLKASIVAGAVLSDVIYYPAAFFIPPNAPNFNEPALHLFGIPVAVCSSFGLLCAKNVSNSLGYALLMGSGIAVANSALNYGVSFLTGLPAWAAPIVTAPVIVTVTLGIPKLVEYCSSRSRFSFWHRESRSTQDEQRERLIPRSSL